MVPTERIAVVTAAIGLGLVVACGRGSGTIGSPGAPSSDQLSGRIVRVLDGSPIARASIQVGDRFATSLASGEFSIGGSVNRNEPITVFALGYLKRQVPFLNQPQATIDLIPDDLPFQLNFYRQWVRDARDSPGALTTLRRRTVAPRFFIKTTVEETGAPVPADIVDRVAEVLANSVPELSGGRFTAAALETGATLRPLVGTGWVRVFFHNSLGGPHGLATVGGDGGTIDLLLDAESSRPLVDDPNGCGYDVVRVAEHEVTHTMGFRHTVNEPEDFHSVPGSGCTGTPRSDKARYHAAVAYSRPIGNADVDVDPSGSFGLVSPTANRVPIVACYF